jgi:hypothetical protein
MQHTSLSLFVVPTSVCVFCEHSNTAHPNGAQSSRSTQKNRKKDVIETSKSKNNI